MYDGLNQANYDREIEEDKRPIYTKCRACNKPITVEDMKNMNDKCQERYGDGPAYDECRWVDITRSRSGLLTVWTDDMCCCFNCESKWNEKGPCGNSQARWGYGG